MLADAVFRVGRAYGMTADRRVYQAVAVTGGRITAVGQARDELDSFAGPGTIVVDDPELVLYPAFADTHNHQLLAARDLDCVPLGGNLVRYWGQDRTGQVMPVRAWVDEEALIAAGSDCNVSFFDPMLSIWGLVTRGTRTAGVQGPGYRVDTYTAIRLYTEAGGRLLREEDSVGILAPGAFADIVGFRGDLLDRPVDDLPMQQPALTLVGGRPVHDPDGVAGAA